MIFWAYKAKSNIFWTKEGVRDEVEQSSKHQGKLKDFLVHIIAKVIALFLRVFAITLMYFIILRKSEHKSDETAWPQNHYIHKRPVNLHSLFPFWKHGSVCDPEKNQVQHMDLKKAGCKKLGHCYSKRGEARLLLLFLNNNVPVFLHPALIRSIFWTWLF